MFIQYFPLEFGVEDRRVNSSLADAISSFAQFGNV